MLRQAFRHNKTVAILTLTKPINRNNISDKSPETQTKALTHMYVYGRKNAGHKDENKTL